MVYRELLNHCQMSKQTEPNSPFYYYWKGSSLSLHRNAKEVDIFEDLQPG